MFCSLCQLDTCVVLMWAGKRQRIELIECSKKEEASLLVLVRHEVRINRRRKFSPWRLCIPFTQQHHTSCWKQSWCLALWHSLIQFSFISFNKWTTTENLLETEARTHYTYAVNAHFGCRLEFVRPSPLTQTLYEMQRKYNNMKNSSMNCINVRVKRHISSSLLIVVAHKLPRISYL